MPLSDQQVRALLLACRETRADELDCEEFLAAMAAYAEACMEGRPVEPPLVAHERLCANCREECHALIAALGAEDPDRQASR